MQFKWPANQLKPSNKNFCLQRSDNLRIFKARWKTRGRGLGVRGTRSRGVENTGSGGKHGVSVENTGSKCKTLQETRLADSGTLRGKDYTFFWQGKSFDEPRQLRVGFAVRNNLLNMVEPGNNGSERLLTLRLNTTAGPVTLVSVYAPTLSATPDTKDEFYDQLSATISNISNKEQLILLGDFNARVGADQ